MVILLAILRAQTYCPIAFRVLLISLIALETSLEAFTRVTGVTVIISLAVDTRHLSDKLLL